MRYFLFTLVAVFTVPLAAQGPPNCNGIGRDVDVRCACIKDPTSKLCDMVKSGFYDSRDWPKPKSTGLSGTFAYTSTPHAKLPTKSSKGRSQPAKPQQARVVPLAHKDYLRFLHPNAYFVAGFDFEKLFRSPELMGALFGQSDTDDARQKLLAALKEMDHLWLSFAAPNDVVLLMTGRFEQGVAAGMFYAQGIWPVFLNDAHAMMIGSEPAIQGALARLAKPAAAASGWVTRRARELSQDHETWLVIEPPPGTNQNAVALQSIRQFALGFRLAGEGSVDGDAVADSEESAEKIAAWIDRIKAATRTKTGVGALDSLTVERNGATLRFAAKGDALVSGDAGKSAMSSDFGVELYSVLMAGFPGMPPRTVAEDKLLAVKSGMKREDVLGLLGRPLAVSAIHGLDPPRETWTYQVPFGKQLSLRLEGGVVTAPPR